MDIIQRISFNTKEVSATIRNDCSISVFVCVIRSIKNQIVLMHKTFAQLVALRKLDRSCCPVG
jgi:hypothetical protein